MSLNHPVRSALACILTALLLTSTAAASASSSDVISAALDEVGYTEGAGEYTKYGEWYGMPHDYWCDMFVSWCAMRAGIPTAKFPRHCSCTSHVDRFVKMDRYESSAARGGSYVPRQGDVIFFYNNIRHPSGSVKNHTGLVLYVEDGYLYTIEGNALTNRLDLSYAEVAELRRDASEPPDRVTVNRYPLNAPHIHGYGVPDYDERTPLALSGFVDLGRQAERAGVFQTVCEEGVMRPTSEHTFSPFHGMTRGEFLTTAMDFFGLAGFDPETPAFGDVPPESPCYDAVMAARSAGIIHGAEDNFFLPDRYISAAAAQTILQRAMACVGLEEQEFTFSNGDFSYIRSSYTIRGDIAQAFYELCQRMPLTKEFEGGIFLNGTALDWPLRQLNDVCYVPLESLQQVFPALERMEDEAFVEPPAGFPLGNTERVVPYLVKLRYGEAPLLVDSFTYHGEIYVDLRPAAALLSLNMERIGGEPPAIAMTGN